MIKKTLLLLLIVLLAPKAVTAQEIYAVLSSDKTKLTFYYDSDKDSRSGKVYENAMAVFDGQELLQWYDCHETVTTVIFDESMSEARPTTLEKWFYNFSKLTDIVKLNYLDTRDVKDMTGVFLFCKSLSTLDLSSFDTSNVKYMSQMFCHCENLISLDLSSFDTSNVTFMNYMFYQCVNLASLDLSSFDTGNVVNMYCMFSYCSSLGTLDLSNFDMRKVQDMSSMFEGNSNLTTIYCNRDWSQSPALEKSADMFQFCKKLVGGNGTTYDKDHIDAAYARFDGGTSSPGYFTMINAIYAVLSSDGKTLTFYYDTEQHSRSGEVYENLMVTFGDFFDVVSHYQWWACHEVVTTVVFDKSMTAVRPKTLKEWFHGFSRLTAIENLNYLDTSDVTDMSSMFAYCLSLTSLDVSSFDTGKVIDMSSMFYECNSLTSLDVSGFETGKVTDMGSMFYACESLTTLDVSNFDIGKVEYMTEMFAQCHNLTTIYCNKDWSKSTVLEYSAFMFYNSTKLVGGKGTTYDNANVGVTYAHPDSGPKNPGYFTKLKEIYAVLSSDGQTLTFYYDDESVSRSGTVYENAIDFSGYPQWVASNGTVTTVVIDESMKDARPKTLRNWFYGFEKLTKIDGLDNLDTRDVTDMGNMFIFCSSLTSIDLSSFDTGNVWTMYCMFAACRSITTLDVSYFDTGKVRNMKDMFHDCHNLTTIYCNKDWSKSTALTDSENMFLSSTSLEGGMGTTYSSSHVDAAYARPDGGPEAPGYFTKPVNNGDVNGDGNVDVADISTIIDIMAGKIFSSKGDVNVDGNIDVADISTVIDIMAGKIVIPQAPADAKGIDLGLPSGTLWANMNVGAKAQNEYGLYFAWGDTKGYSAESGHAFTWETYKWMAAGQSSWEHITKYTIEDDETEGDWYNTDYEFIGDGNTQLSLEDDAARASWGGKWVMPTIEHIRELKKYTTSEWTTLNGVVGQKFTSKQNGNAIFLPAAGYMGSKGIDQLETTGNYWSSSLSSSTSIASELWFKSTLADPFSSSRNYGQSIRPIIKGTKPFAE